MATRTSTKSGSWSDASAWDTGAPADGDAVTIAAGHNVLMDTDLSAWTGLLTVTISGGATTPGMLYFASGTSGYLKIRTGYNLVGTSGAAKGRLHASATGATWADTTALPFANKAVIGLGATSKIDAQYLDIALYCVNPTHAYVRTYGVRKTATASASTDTFTSASHGLANGTPVMVMSSGTLPGGLVADYVYYVVATATSTFKLAPVSGGTAIDLTSDGSGTIEVYTGAASGANPVKVFEDVTAETGWTNAAGHNRVVAVSAGQNYDQQRLTITTLASDAITLSAALDSLQYPGARIYLVARNVSIRSACTTAVNIVDYAGAATSAGVLGCEIWSSAGTGTTFYGTGVYYGTGHTISGAVSGCTNGVYSGTGHTISGTVSGGSTGVYSGTGHTISGTVSGCTYGVYSGTGHTISGTVSGCTYTVCIGDDGPANIVARGTATLPTPPTFYGRNISGDGHRGLKCEDYGGVLGASYAFFCTGDVIRNASIVRSGGADNSLEVVPLSACGTIGVAGATADGKIPIFEWVELDVPASAQTRSVYVRGEGWTTWPTAAQLYLEAEYFSDDAPMTTTVVASTQVLTDNTTWTALSVSCTPHMVSRVRYRMWLGAYQAASKIYVDNQLVTS